MNDHKPRLVLDMDALVRVERSNAYWACDGLYPELALSEHFDVEFAASPELSRKADDYLRALGLERHSSPFRGRQTGGTEIVLSPSGVAPRIWRDDPYVVRAHIIYELLALESVGLFSDQKVEESQTVVASLDSRTVVFVFANQTKQDVLRLRPDLSPAQVTVIPPASARCFWPCELPERLAATRAKYGIPPGVPYVLGEWKDLATAGIERVAHAIASLGGPESHGLCLVLLVEESRQELELELATMSQCRSQVVLVGPLEEEDLAPIFSDAVCLVQISERERSGFSALAAMSCGTPVICASSAIGALVGDAGVLLDSGDQGDLARAIARISGQPSVRQSFRSKCLLRSTQFDWRQSAAAMKEVLLDAHRRFMARPASMLWQYPSELPADRSLPASFLGFHNGANGPAYGVAAGAATPAWPRWSNALPTTETHTRPEGGLRARGALKVGTDDEPLVSYVTVVRNNVATLGRAIESVQRQTYRNVEHIVLDGASSDGTLDLILSHADRLDYYVSEPDRGLYDAINKAVPLARGQLICILNSDDWLEPHAAEIAVRRMRGRTGGASLLATGAVIYSLSGNVEVEWPPMFVHPGSYFACANICHNGVYATPTAYERSGPYDTSFRIAADFKWVMASLDAGVEFVYTREVTVNYSLGGTSGDARGHSGECQRVVAERFPFLSKDDVLGLYDSYFLFAHQPHDEPTQPRETLTMFLRRLFASHTDRPDFQAALTWAAMTKLEHPLDARPSQAQPGAEVVAAQAIPSIRRSAKDLVKGLLYRYPRLYHVALRGYARMRR